MGKDKFTASDSNMKNDVESASASTIEEDRASASDIDDDTNYGIEMIWSPDWRVTWGYLKGLIKEVPTQKDRAGECCIYRVPNSLRDRNPEAFSPQLISIGPFHCDHERGQSMKHIYLREFLKRNAMDDKLFTNFLRRIQKKEKSIRLCYSASFFTYTQEFVEMIVLDAVFIIEFLKDSYDDAFPQTVDTRMISCIGEDLMLPENQLPFSVIDSIYSEFYQDEQNITFLNLATRHFGKYPFAQGPESTPPTDARHFTDLLMKLMLKGALKRDNCSKPPIKLKYSAVTLRKGGVKFQVSKDKCLFNVHFKNGVLKIPLLEVDDSLERFVRNVMAWEYCSKPSEAHMISNYFKFMDHLIDRAEDVALLAEEGIIKNWLGDDAAVSKLINNLSQRSEKTCYYSDICQTLNDYYEDPWNRRRATLELVYFSNLWRGTATVAAAFLLILTLIQTITSLKSSF
ncbi:UPF0481 protein At3g47200-like isoform X2 [Populus alba]|nr:UPF0481 protein At3g47200-like [Populus alba]